MQNVTKFMALSAVVLVGCGGVVPMEGTWVLSDTELDSNGCEFEDIEDGDDSSMAITVNSDDALKIVLDEEIELECSLEKGAFDCTPLTVEMDSLGDGSAIVSTSQTFSGNFASDSAGAVFATVEFSCEGDQCDAIAQGMGVPIPCTTEISATITHSGS